MHRRRILLVSPCWPCGPAFGGRLRAFHTARALQHVGDVTIVVASSDTNDDAAARLSTTTFDVLPPFTTSVRTSRSLQDRLRWAFDTRFCHVNGVAATPDSQERMMSYLSHFDLVWLLHLRTANLFSRWKWPGTHLDIDDVPSSFLWSTARDLPLLARCGTYARALLLRRRERILPQRFTTVSVCSDADRRLLPFPNVYSIPNGFVQPHCESPRTPSNEQPRFGFIGLYSYAPNRDAVRWFLRDVWPRIKQSLPTARFRLIGQGTDGPQRPTHPDVDALGWLEDPTSEINSWSAMVLPIRVGGGTRVKLAEAFSRKCPVVSTTVGAYGYEVLPGRELELADEPHRFADACVRLVRNPNEAAAMAERAWGSFIAKWTWDAIMPRIWHAADTCMRRQADGSTTK